MLILACTCNWGQCTRVKREGWLLWLSPGNLLSCAPESVLGCLREWDSVSPGCPQCSVRKMQLGKHAHVIPDYFYWHAVKALWKDSLSPESTVTVLFCLRTNCLLSDGAILVLRHFGFKSLGSPVGLDGPSLQPQNFRGWETRINNSYLSRIQTGSRAGWAVWDCVSVCIFVVQWKDYKIWLWDLSKISHVMSLHLRS